MACNFKTADGRNMGAKRFPTSLFGIFQTHSWAVSSFTHIQRRASFPSHITVVCFRTSATLSPWERAGGWDARWPFSASISALCFCDGVISWRELLLRVSFSGLIRLLDASIVGIWRATLDRHQPRIVVLEFVRNLTPIIGFPFRSCHFIITWLKGKQHFVLKEKWSKKIPTAGARNQFFFSVEILERNRERRGNKGQLDLPLLCWA